MLTSINLPEDVMLRLAARAEKSGLSTSAYIQETLERHLDAIEPAEAGKVGPDGQRGKSFR